MVPSNTGVNTDCQRKITTAMAIRSAVDDTECNYEVEIEVGYQTFLRICAHDF